ncbi:hypothetical protein BDF14DRAFT_1857725 [Spinellus fusiger]|nr:hypothetical protein BDF14DRAFT_1857725 [Spinellus fusiger]
MASTPSEAIDLLSDINLEKLQHKYTHLLNLYNDAQQQITLLDDSLKSTKSQVEKRTTVQSQYEAAKDQISTLETTAAANERKNTELIRMTNSELLEAKDTIKTLKEKLHEERLQKHRLAASKEDATTSTATLKLEVEALTARLESTVRREDAKTHQLHILENELKDQKYKSDFATERFTRQLADHQQEKVALESTLANIRTENQSLKFENAETKREASIAMDRCQALELQLMATKSEQKESKEMYEAQQKLQEEYLEATQTKMAALEIQSQQKVQEAQNSQRELEKALAHRQQQLDLSRKQVEKFIGVIRQNEQEDRNNSVNSGSTTLLALISKYESTGKHWDEVYSDFFDLREDYVKTVAQAEGMRGANEELLRETQDQQQWQERAQAELERLRYQLASSERKNKDYASVVKKNAEELEHFKSHIAGLDQEDEKLRESLTDTTYQLRFLLNEAQLRDQPLPAALQATAAVFIDTTGRPHLGHDELVFKNITELLERNQHLTHQCRELSKELKQKTCTLEDTCAESTKNEGFYTHALNEAKHMITELEEEIKSSKSKIHLLSSEKDQYQHIIEEYKKQTSPEIHAELQSRVEDYKQRLKENEQQADVYQIEVNGDFQKMKALLDDARRKSNTAQQELAHTKATLSHLEEQISNLKYTCQERQTLITELRQKNIELQSKVSTNEDLLQQALAQVQHYHRTHEAIREENLQLTSENKVNASRSEMLTEQLNELSTQYRKISDALVDLSLQRKAFVEGSEQHAGYWKERCEEKCREVEVLTEKVAKTQTDTQEYPLIDSREWQDKCMMARGELQQITTSYNETCQQLETARQEKHALELKVATLSHASAKQESSEEPLVSILSEKDTTESIEKYKAQVVEAEQKIQVLESTLADYQGRLVKERQETKELNEKYEVFVKDIQTTLDKKTEDVATYTTRVRELQQELETVLVEMKKIKEDMGSSEQQWTIEKLALVAEKEELKVLEQTKTTELETLHKDVERYLQAKEDINVQLQSEHTKLQAALSEASQYQTQALDLKAQVTEATSKLTEAQAKIKAGETSLSRQKEHTDAILCANEESLRELKKERATLAAQVEKLLGQWTEATSSSTAAPTELPDSVDKTIKQVFEMNAILRQSKETLESRYRQSQIQQLKLENSLEQTQKQLAHTRLALESLRAEKTALMLKEEQQRTEANNLVSVYKDSNDTLRTELSQASTRIETLEKQVDAKQKEMEPMITKIVTLESDLAHSAELIRSLEMTQTELTTRASELMAKRNLIDPEDLKKLQETLEASKAECASLEKTKQEALDKVASIEVEKNAMFERFKRVATVAKHKETALVEMKAKLENATKGAQGSTDLEEKIKTLQESLEAAELEKKISHDSLVKRMDEYEALNKKHMSLFTRARQIAAEKNRALDDVKALKTKSEEDDEALSQLGKKIEENTALIQQLTEENKQFKSKGVAVTDTTATANTANTANTTAAQEAFKTALAQKEEQITQVELENKRLKAMQSMMTNKNNKLANKIAELTAKLPSSIIVTTTSSSSSSSPSQPSHSEAEEKGALVTAPSVPISVPISILPPAFTSPSVSTSTSNVSPVQDTPSVLASSKADMHVSSEYVSVTDSSPQTQQSHSLPQVSQVPQVPQVQEEPQAPPMPAVSPPPEGLQVSPTSEETQLILQETREEEEEGEVREEGELHSSPHKNVFVETTKSLDTQDMDMKESHSEATLSTSSPSWTTDTLQTQPQKSLYALSPLQEKSQQALSPSFLQDTSLEMMDKMMNETPSISADTPTPINTNTNTEAEAEAEAEIETEIEAEIETETATATDAVVGTKRKSDEDIETPRSPKKNV